MIKRDGKGRKPGSGEKDVRTEGNAGRSREGRTGGAVPAAKELFQTRGRR